MEGSIVALIMHVREREPGGSTQGGTCSGFLEIDGTDMDDESLE